jgi:hypothetical protein
MYEVVGTYVFFSERIADQVVYPPIVFHYIDRFEIRINVDETLYRQVLPAK